PCPCACPCPCPNLCNSSLMGDEHAMMLSNQNRDNAMRFYLDHERLEVYRFAIKFVVLAEEIAENLPRGRAYLVDQLRFLG
ncbi:MAG: hypothetical protein ACE5GN_03850, partial [Waddliaceae bacterium]